VALGRWCSPRPRPRASRLLGANTAAVAWTSALPARPLTALVLIGRLADPPPWLAGRGQTEADEPKRVRSGRLGRPARCRTNTRRGDCGRRWRAGGIDHRRPTPSAPAHTGQTAASFPPTPRRNARERGHELGAAAPAPAEMKRLAVCVVVSVIMAFGGSASAHEGGHPGGCEEFGRINRDVAQNPAAFGFQCPRLG
jgi:hypothetical protein